LDWPEKNWGLKYVGWSETMDGVKIPKPKPLTKGWRVEKAENLIHHAARRPGTVRASLLERIAALLAKIPKDR
jgi:hypothetical protein